MNWYEKRILVLGAGETGRSVVDHLRRLGAGVRVADSRVDSPAAAQLAASHPDLDIVTGRFTDALFRDAELIVASPGVAVAGPACDPAIARAAAYGKAVVGDIELFAWQQNQITGPRPKVIGITGANGKSTVTTMAGAMCRAAGMNTVVAGNIGLPILDALHATPNADAYVLELSSFQLETTASLKLDAATMLNLSEDHLDRYHSMQDYAHAKQRIFLNARHQVLNREDPVSMRMREAALSATTFGLDRPEGDNFGVHAGDLMMGASPLLPLEDMPIAGLHNAANALAAFALCRAIGVDSEQATAGLKQFKGLPHRLQLVGTINGVNYYDDSKGTNVGATVAALNGMTVATVLIAGGIGKDQDFSPLLNAVRRVGRAVVLIGRDAGLIEAALKGSNVDCIREESLLNALLRAHLVAKPGDAVLLSPACSSFDMFKNYVERGEMFAAGVEMLASAIKRRRRP